MQMPEIFANPSWVQAIAAVIMVFLAGATLLVLWRYAKDTKKIAQTSVEQAENARKQATESQRQSDAAIQSLTLLKQQIQGQQAQEVARVMTILRAIHEQARIWFDVIDQNRWGMPPSQTVKFLPDDWPVVAYLASRVGMRKDVNALEKLLGDANSQISQFLNQPIAYRSESLIRAAHPNLEKAMKSLPGIIEKFQTLED